jgi:predicted esterase
MRRLLWLSFLLTAVPLFGAEPARGKLVENVAALGDATQTYTLYLPASYDPAHAYPLLFVFDPRSRGTLAAEIFRAAAEEYGWILISSNQTRSDDDGAPNARALKALLPESNRYAIDPKRIYAAGFSGTAMLSWAVGVTTGGLAGVIGVGGRLVEQIPPSKFSFAHYGFSGDSDFNNREMRLVDAELEKAGKPHRFETFPGDHRWIGPELARDAVGWMEVMAMKEGRRGRDEALSGRLYAADAARAQALEAAGKGPEALRRYRAIASTYDGLIPLAAAGAQVARLQADPAVKKALKDEAAADSYEQRYRRDVLGSIPSLLAAAQQAHETPTAAGLARDLQVGDLKRRAAHDTYDGAAARRLLESLFAQTAFYMMRDLMARHEYALAAAVRGVATENHPDRWPPWYNLGAAYARAGDRRRALDALEKAIAAGFHDAAGLEADEDYAGVRGEERYRQLTMKLGS